MIKKLYYSTLNHRIYTSKKEAQKAEDKYVAKHFENLHKKVEKTKKLRNESYTNIRIN